MTKEEVVICIDAGGTSTKINVYNMCEEIVTSVIEPTISPAIVRDLSFNSLDSIVNKLFLEIKDKYHILNITMGISALGVVIDVKGLEEKFSNKYGCPVYIKTDCLIALYSVICDSYLDIYNNEVQDAVLALGGTGSAVAGVKDGKYYQVGGYGQFIRERGSAYALVHELCLKMIDKYEHNEPLSNLDKALLKDMDITEVPHLKAIYYLQDKGRIASHASLITKMAEEKDRDAVDILYQEALAITENIKTLVDVNNFNKNVTLGFKGGMFKHNGLITNMVVDILTEQGYNFKYVIDDKDPITGAYYLAKALALGEKNVK